MTYRSEAVDCGQILLPRCVVGFAREPRRPHCALRTIADEVGELVQFVPGLPERAGNALVVTSRRPAAAIRSSPVN